MAAARIAALSKLVDECAAGGDAIAQDLLNVAAQQLSSITTACRRQLFKEDEKVFVAHIGGVFKSEPLRERFRFLVEFYGTTTLGEPKMIRPPERCWKRTARFTGPSR